MRRPHDDEAPGAATWRRLLLRLWPLAALVALLAAALLSNAGELLSLTTLKSNHAALADWVAGHPWMSRAAFLALVASAMAIGFPIVVVMSFAAGLLFGVWGGAALSLVGATAGGLVFFLAARHARAAVLSSRRLAAACHWIESGFRGNEFLALMTLRLVPVLPTTGVTICAAAARMNVRDFVLGSLVGSAPATIIYAWLGASAARLLATEAPLDDALLKPEFLAPLIGLAGLSLLAIWLRRRAARD